MKKTVKKLDNNVIKALTIVCEEFKNKGIGFEWLTHTADYANFPGSLIVTCVFDSNSDLQNAKNNQTDIEIRVHIQKQLFKAGILLKDARRHVCFDTEEACLAESDGNWKLRL
ncbi:Fis family transcriptional regulator [Alteromonadaceae bacterium M269]|nr:Fis family transcriptional regulator [Alteromonadaceae bacterium M269]